MGGYNFFYQNTITIPLVAFCLAVALKAISIRIKTWYWNLEKSFWSGGMPSAHSAVVVSLATAMALKHSVSSDLFAIAMTFTVIIIYDAINVRYESGLHAKAINEELWEKRFKESLGHLPSEAFAGSLLWILVAIFLFYL